MEALEHPVRCFGLDLRTGRVRVARCGGPGPLVLCLPGLSANLRSFDFIAARLARAGFDVVALDLRGRGRSDVTPPGTYGWSSHAADAAEVAHQLGADSVSVLGWSMGAFVAMQLAATEPGLLDKVVLIDACAATSEASNELIQTVIDRLGVVYPSVKQYLDLVQRLGTIVPWSPLWEDYFEYELEAIEGGVRARTSPKAVAEDFRYTTSHDPRRLWSGLTMPTLLVRASRPITPGGPFIVSEEDRDDFLRSVPAAELAEVNANHYGVVADAATADAITGFLHAPAAEGGR